MKSYMHSVFYFSFFSVSRWHQWTEWDSQTPTPLNSGVGHCTGESSDSRIATGESGTPPVSGGTSTSPGADHAEIQGTDHETHPEQQAGEDSGSQERTVPGIRKTITSNFYIENYLLFLQHFTNFTKFYQLNKSDIFKAVIFTLLI